MQKRIRGITLLVLGLTLVLASGTLAQLTPIGKLGPMNTTIRLTTPATAFPYGSRTSTASAWIFPCLRTGTGSTPPP